MNSTMSPCVPTVQSVQSEAFSNAHSSDTVQRSAASSFAAMGGNRRSRRALRHSAQSEPKRCQCCNT